MSIRAAPADIGPSPITRVARRNRTGCQLPPGSSLYVGQLEKALVRGDTGFWNIGSVGATLAVCRELKPAFPTKEIDHRRIHRGTKHVSMRPMLPLTFVSLSSSASMVMARRRDIQRAVENFNEAIRLGRAYDRA
jgi:hypothetical protein